MNELRNLQYHLNNIQVSGSSVIALAICIQTVEKMIDAEKMKENAQKSEEATSDG